MTAFLKSIINHPFAERILIALIVINAITLGLETSPSIVAKWGSVIQAVDHAILAVLS